MPNTQEECIILLEKIRWNGFPTCPYCKSIQASVLRRESRYHCNECFTSYSVTVGTLFHGTRVTLPKWFRAIWLVMRRSQKLSIRQLAIEIDVNKNTASYMLDRIHIAMRKEVELINQIAEYIESS
jgi:transposase-like protein